MKKIVMVCLGNICRSPMAEGILRHKAIENGIEIEIDSCGTSAWHIGQAPDSRAIENLHAHDINIEDLRARQFSTSDFSKFDLIYAMDKSNYDDIISLASNAIEKSKVKLILNESNPGQNLAVPDPYYGGDNGFESVYNMLEIACDKIIDKIN